MNEGSLSEKHHENQARKLTQIELGRELLGKQGINPDQYRKYFPILRRSDVPLISRLPDLDALTYLEDIPTIEGAEEAWASLKKLYDRIDVKEHDENTGRDIIIEMKILFECFDQLFRKYAAQTKRELAAGEKISPPNPELKSLHAAILQLSRRYASEVPAYESYREVGRFELDPQGHRQFQGESRAEQ